MGSNMCSPKFGVMRSSGGDAQSSSEERRQKSHGFELLVGGRWWNERAYVGGWVDGQKKINKAYHLE